MSGMGTGDRVQVRVEDQGVGHRPPATGEDLRPLLPGWMPHPAGPIPASDWDCSSAVR